MKAWERFLFNTQERLYHKVSPQEIALLKATDLFSQVDKTFFQELLRSIRLINYPKEKLIFREGEQGDALYIILNGAVRVFTNNNHGLKIPLARLNTGDYFGEQALLGDAKRTRNASIETIDETTLIRINRKIIKRFLALDTRVSIFFMRLPAKTILF